jgi:hypothetical protein
MKKVLIALVVMTAWLLPARAQTPPTKAPTDDCTALWKEYDANDDGILSGDEAAELKAILAAIDTNKDGTVSKDEFMVACSKGILKNVKKR